MIKAGEAHYGSSVSLLTCLRRATSLRYRSDRKLNCTRLSEPLLDRIDRHIEVPRIPHKDLTYQSPAESSATIHQRVNRARQIRR